MRRREAASSETSKLAAVMTTQKPLRIDISAKVWPRSFAIADQFGDDPAGVTADEEKASFRSPSETTSVVSMSNNSFFVALHPRPNPVPVQYRRTASIYYPHDFRPGATRCKVGIQPGPRTDGYAGSVLGAFCRMLYGTRRRQRASSTAAVPRAGGQDARRREPARQRARHEDRPRSSSRSGSESPWLQCARRHGWSLQTARLCDLGQDLGALARRHCSIGRCARRRGMRQSCPQRLSM